MIPILGSLIEIGGTWLKGKQEETKAKAVAKLVEITADSDIKKAKAIAAIHAAETGQQQDFDLDRIAMEQMGKSWKDELVLIIFLAPMVMAFIPGMDTYSLAGFEVIQKMPEWYQYIIMGMVIVIYGMRGMVKQLVSNKLSIKKD
tara:strand:- start:817 stop:1251 length:435 start_codon:yes stop_codon:yes gene_type:complete